MKQGSKGGLKLRLATGSVWPAIVLHAAWNAIIQTVFDPASAGPRVALWVGESGILVVIVVTVIAIVVSRGQWCRHHLSPAMFVRVFAIGLLLIGLYLALRNLL